MKRLNNFLVNLVADEQGQSTTEYILILAVVVMVAMKFKTTFSSKLSGIVEQVGGQISSAVGQGGGGGE